MATPLTYYPEPRAILGEAPIWNGGTRQLYWVDCDQKILFQLDPSDHAITSTVLSHSPGSYAFRRKGGMIMAYRNALAFIDPASGAHEAIETGIDFGMERFNDGKCDRKGRFWVGTLDRKFQNPVGALYCVDADLNVRQMAHGFTVSNGLAFSPDDRTLYHSDSRRPCIYAHDFDLETGTLANQRVFIDYGSGHIHPDGCTVDAEGHLWIAEIGGSRIARYDPAGRCVRVIELPVSRPTSVMFGGPDLRTLYVTTMQFRLTPEALERQPQAGCLFAIDVGVGGLPEPAFAA